MLILPKCQDGKQIGGLELYGYKTDGCIPDWLNCVQSHCKILDIRTPASQQLSSAHQYLNNELNADRTLEF